MTKHWSLLFTAVAASLTLSAFTRSESREVTANEGFPADSRSGYPQRLQLAGALPADAAPVQPEGAVWQMAGSALHFGLPEQADLLSIGCSHAPDGTAMLRVTRRTRAEEGAKALFALIGNGRIARLPLDTVQPGENGAWQGLIPARDERLDVLKGGNRIEATLPGGGTLKLPASSEPGRVLETCRSSDHGPETVATPA